MSLSHNIVFEISLFPYDVPLPHPTTSGHAIGGVLYAKHMMRWSSGMSIMRRGKWQLSNRSANSSGITRLSGRARKIAVKSHVSVTES
ncbi:hypothetical protein BS47DRAFT_1345086 [Hydnum rufescens UP504]|uniref:Uncharacterized protein n=1 Tax=Hydnum rufescens UP504 TaxID=1448309 RepID=A0A9P6AXW8_9AGAM|nr:hypothetical protein BS47DRAFT_1345086 [Hydnum rufescens UP504]